MGMGMGKGKKCDGTLIECACEKCSLLSSFLQRNTQGERNQLMGNLTLDTSCRKCREDPSRSGTMKCSGTMIPGMLYVPTNDIRRNGWLSVG